MANGEFEIFHVRQHSNMLIISPNRCIRRRFAACVCIRSWGVYSRGAARVGVESFFYRRRAVACSFLQSAKQRGRCYWAMGFYVKTVLVTIFQGFPNRFSLVGCYPSCSYCLILHWRFILNLRLRHFGSGIAVLPGQFFF